MGLFCLGYDIMVFDISCQVSRFGLIRPVSRSTAIRCFDKSEFIYFRITGQTIDQPDVWAFRSFDRTHTAIVGSSERHELHNQHGHEVNPPAGPIRLKDDVCVSIRQEDLFGP